MKDSFSSRLALALTLLFLALGFSCLPVEAAKAKAPKMLDIADTINTNRILTKFAEMLQNSDLATFLSSKGPFTVFVPTDSAFSKLPAGTLDALLRPENKERLQKILLYHVVNGKSLTSKDLLKLTSLISCEGTPLTVHTTKSGTQLIQKVKIIHSDMRCLNGVINEIDTVLMPPEKSLPPLAAAPPPAAVAPSPDTNAAPVNPAMVTPSADHHD